MIYEYWLAGIKEITDLKKQKLREVYGSGKAIYYIEETKLDKLRFLNEKDVAILKNAKKIQNLKKNGEGQKKKRIQFIPYFLKTYPEKLKYITDPPYALYVLGQLPDEKKKSAAIVGARNCTAYGEQMALQYGKSLAEAGIQIISGMARGIDGAGQRGALNSSWAKESGVTYAVLGCGGCLLSKREYRIVYGYTGKRRNSIRIFTRNPAVCVEFSKKKSNHQCAGGLDTYYGSKRKERIIDYCGSCIGAGKGCICSSGTGKQCVKSGCHRLIKQERDIDYPEELMDEWNINPVEIGQKGNKSEKNA